ncbi:MAG: chorismate mutase, partial [Lentisphaerae bacterium]|nr:chorismate mutase [Lentisphaerota bacterium]
MNQIRQKIDELDAQIVKLLNERANQAIAIGKLKESKKSAVYVPTRERDVFERVWAANEGPLKNESLEAIYREIMSASLSLEKKPVIAFLGPFGTFSHQAATGKFGKSVDYRVCETIKDVFDSVHKGKADYGVVPVENSTEGAVTHTLDAFYETP